MTLKLSKQHVWLIIGLIFLISLIFALPAFAQAPTSASGEVGQNGGFVICGNTADNPCNIRDLFRAFILIINYLITMAGFVAVASIVYAGLMMVYSQGGAALKDAKSRLSNSIIGLVLVASAFVLINAIFAGSFSVGLKDGGLIFTDPAGFIQGGPEAVKTEEENAKKNNNKANTNNGTTPKPSTTQQTAPKTTK